MKKFIKGTFELDQNIGDLTEYEAKKELWLKSVIQWANEHDIEIVFGASDDDCYLCEYMARANTSSLCRGYAAELRKMLKIGFPKIKLLYQASGNLLW